MNQCDKCGARDNHEDKNSMFYATDFFWHGDIEEDYDMGDYSCLCRECFNQGNYWIDREMKIHLCELCEGKGYALIYNTKKKINEIQKCDECAIFESDFDAQLEAEFKKHEFQTNSI